MSADLTETIKLLAHGQQLLCLLDVSFNYLPVGPSFVCGAVDAISALYMPLYIKYQVVGFVKYTAIQIGRLVQQKWARNILKMQLYVTPYLDGDP